MNNPIMWHILGFWIIPVTIGYLVVSVIFILVREIFDFWKRGRER